MLSELHEYLEAEGRDPRSLPVGKRVYVAIDRPPHGVSDFFHAVYGGAISPNVAISRSPDQVLDELLQLREAGAEPLLVSPWVTTGRSVSW